MIELIIAVAAVFVVLIIAEILRRRKWIRGELARKFVHITVGSFVAFWPFFMSWNQIRIMCAAFIIVVVADRHLKVFKSLHGVNRRTVGDILFPVGIFIATYVSSSPWIFTVAILHLSLGDGAAAVIGHKYGKKYSYSILHQRKSTAGSIAFWMVSVCITSALLLFMPVNLDHAAFAILFIMPVASALLEGLSIFGIDNVTVPVTIAISLSVLQSLA